MSQMDTSVSVCRLSVLLVSFCEVQSVPVVSGVGAGSVPEAAGARGYSPSRSAHGCWRRPSTRRPCHGKAVIFLPPVVLLLLGLGSCLLLLNRPLSTGGEPANLLDIFRSNEDVETDADPNEDAGPQITSISITNTAPSIQGTVSVPALAPGTTHFLAPSSFIPSSTPPLFGKYRFGPLFIRPVVQSYKIASVDSFLRRL